jgi:hypothetical protein
MKKTLLICLLVLFAACGGHPRLRLCRPSLEAAKRFECERFAWCDDKYPNRGAFTVGSDSNPIFTADTNHPWREWKQVDDVPRWVMCP